MSREFPDLADETLEGFVRKPLGILWWGPPKGGKTVAAHTFPRTRTLDFDDGMQSVLWAIREGIIKKDPAEIVYRTIIPSKGERNLKERPSVLDRATDTLDQWREELDEWDTLVVDSATDVSEACINRALFFLGKHKPSYSDTAKESKKLGFRVMSRQDWGPAMSQFQDFIDQVREFKDYGKNVIVICHEYEETTDSGIVRAKYPLLIGQLRQRITKQFDEVYYQCIGGDDDDYGIQTVADRKIKAGSRLGVLPEFMPNPTYEKIMNLVEAHAS